MSKKNKHNLLINGERLNKRIKEMSQIGATDKGGCNRQALTDLDKQGRDLFIQWSKDAGCTVQVDEIGNLFIRRAGRDNNLPVIVTGSHLDTQPTGGKYDGVYGVLAGLEVVESLNDHDLQTDHPIEIVVWTNEEGARFTPAMMGSGVFSGVFELQDTLNIKDKNGISVKQALNNIGYVGNQGTDPKDIKAAFEVHIEQGPILEDEDKQIGIVTGIQGIRWYDLTLYGEPVHAGPTPMSARKDPMRALVEIVGQLYQMVEKYGPWSRVTFGDISLSPGSRNTVPESITLAVDLRHPEQKILDEMDKVFREIMLVHSKAYGLRANIKDEWNLPAVNFAQSCIESVEVAVTELGYANMHMVSGAGHDSGYVSKVAPTSMIFVPCEKGISHNEAENAKIEDLTAGCNVLLHAILAMACVS